mgnify:CR=1 FL=1
MSAENDKINMIELLMGIKEDVSSIKTDMANFKESQRTEKDIIMKEISGVRTDYKRDLSELEACVMGRITNMQSIQSSLVGDVDTLKSAEDKKDAKHWRMTIAFVLTGLGGMALAKIPDFIAFCIKLKGD